MKKKPILLLDFDGVIHSYKSGWQGVRCIPDSPVKGALQFITEATKYFNVCIYSARSSQFLGKRAMKQWLKKEYINLGLSFQNQPTPEDPFFSWICQTAFADPWADEVKLATKRLLRKIKFPTKKPAVFLTIDDRAIQFTGKFIHPKELLKFKSWTKKKFKLLEEI